MTATLPRKPRIHLTGSEALVWDVEDVRYLRQTLRITGALAGSLPRSPMQNIFQGLPLRLMAEEVFALEAKDLVVIVDEVHSYSIPSTAEQEKAYTQKKQKMPMDQISVSTHSDSLPWYHPQRQLLSPFVRTFPTDSQIQPTSHQHQSGIRSKVFMHLWDQLKYFVAPGLKFGGDYLLYKQDPLICHASFVASVKDMNEPLSLTDLATSARLATTVQKKHLLCSYSGPPTLSPEVRRESLPGPGPGPGSEPSSSVDVQVFAVEWAGF